MRIFCHPPLSDTLKNTFAEHSFLDVYSVCEQPKALSTSPNAQQLMHSVAAAHAETLIISLHAVESTKFCANLAHLYDNSTRPALIFSSMDEKSSYTAYQLGADGYLLEPIDERALRQTLQRITQPTLAHINPSTQPPTSSAAIITSSSKGLQRVRLSDVYYLSADQKYLKLHHRHGVDLVDNTLKHLGETFGETLCRIHRNTLVNLDYAQGISHLNSQPVLQLADAHHTELVAQLPISRRLLPALRRKLKQRFSVGYFDGKSL